MSWSNFFANPHASNIKKYLFAILKEKYAENEKFIDRICVGLTVEEDATGFVKLVRDCFERGFMTSVEQHKESLSKLGMKINLTREAEEGQKIFKND
jgi:hypothetical protein